MGEFGSIDEALEFEIDRKIQAQAVFEIVYDNVALKED